MEHNESLMRGLRIVGGSLLVVSGVAMLVLPGPGLVALGAGLALLSRDVPAARRLLRRLRPEAEPELVPVRVEVQSPR
ncbi:MAG: PGPGW domain-containing protein [Myxococcota bacterium]